MTLRDSVLTTNAGLPEAAGLQVFVHMHIYTHSHSNKHIEEHTHTCNSARHAHIYSWHRCYEFSRP